MVPILSNKKVVAVLDVDSDQLNDFDEIDQVGLEAIANLLSDKF